MALIECKECKSQVSDMANTCPKCGCPINNPSINQVKSTTAPKPIENKPQPKKS